MLERAHPFGRLAQHYITLSVIFIVEPCNKVIYNFERKTVRANLPIAGTPYHLQDIADTTKTCYWNDFNYGVDMTKPGAQQYYDNLVQKYADWGVDFIKFDDIVPYPDEVCTATRFPPVIIFEL